MFIVVFSFGSLNVRPPSDDCSLSSSASSSISPKLINLGFSFSSWCSSDRISGSLLLVTFSIFYNIGVFKSVFSPLKFGKIGFSGMKLSADGISFRVGIFITGLFVASICTSSFPFICLISDSN